MLLDYTKNNVPKNYKCHICDVQNVKLWRDSRVCASDITLFCARCASLKTNVDISSINKEGVYFKEYLWTDQIEDLLPAVPTENERTFWHYTTVPQIAIEWWKRLPTLSFPKIIEMNKYD